MRSSFPLSAIASSPSRVFDAPRQELLASLCRCGSNNPPGLKGCRFHRGYTALPCKLRKIALLIVFILPFAAPHAATSQNADRHYLSHEISENRITVSVTDGYYNLIFYNRDIVETTFVPGSGPATTPSHAVVLHPQNLDVAASETSAELIFNSGGIRVRIAKSPFQISYFLGEKPLISEKAGYTETADGFIFQFNLSEDERLYGTGARVLGMNRRGNRLQLYNRAHYGYETRSELMNYTMPIVVSSEKYMVHFDNAPIGWLDLDSQRDNTLAYQSISGRKTYQVVASESWEGLLSNYTLLTGRQPLPPLWAFGNFASRFGYHSQAEAERTIRKFRGEKIPVDAIILDLYWFGKDIKGTMGNLEVYRDSFPQFEKMIADFRKSGVKTIPITEPFILTTSSKWDEAVSENILATDKAGNPFTYDFYFGNTGLIDIFKPEGKQWFWNIYKDLANKGAAGVWGDLGEPEVHPSELQHATGSADEVHNIYGHEWAKLVFSGYRLDFPHQRPFILMRSGYSGSQRYGMIPWSGDVNRTWGGLSGQVEIALQMGMQGLAYMHSDLGGFAGANPDNELYVRWLQYGVFQPIFRPHAQEEVPSEPVYRDKKTRELAKKAVELRYRLLPYNYTLAFENSQTGMPMMRPMFFEEPDNPGLYENSSQYLWGPDFLVSPVISPEAKLQRVYFPKTSNWFDFASGTKHAAGSSAEVALTADRIPVFVRGGAIIPMIGVIQTTDDFDKADFSLHYFFDPDQSKQTSRLYLDDGHTPDAYHKGGYAIFHFTSEADHREIRISVAPEKGVTFQPFEKSFRMIVNNLQKKPKTVVINGEKVRFEYKKGVLSFKSSFNLNATQDIFIRLQ